MAHSLKLTAPAPNSALPQTGTGKTHTMTGNIDSPGEGLSPGAGVIPRAIHQIFNYLEASAGGDQGHVVGGVASGGSC